MITTTSLLHKQDDEKAASIKTDNARRFTSIKFCVLSNILFPLRNHLIRPSFSPPIINYFYELLIQLRRATYQIFMKNDDLINHWLRYNKRFPHFFYYKNAPRTPLEDPLI